MPRKRRVGSTPTSPTRSSRVSAGPRLRAGDSWTFAASYHPTVSTRSRTLARRFLDSNEVLIDLVAGLSDEQWRAACPREGRTVGEVVLERAGFIRRDEDLWRAKRPLLRLDDPFLRFYFAVVRRNVPLFETRRTEQAWAESQTAFAPQVLGPHFEQVARTWTERFASTGIRAGGTRSGASALGS